MASGPSDGLGTAPAPEQLRCLLITHNVCGIFDHMDDALPVWVKELQALVAEQAADFVALHLQEVGGEEWKSGELRLDRFMQALDAGFAATEFWSSGLMLLTDTHPRRYTALGSIYLVRRTALHRVRLWHFGGVAGSEAGFRSLDGLPSPLLGAPELPAAYARHERFDQTFFPEYPEWSRKGYMHTRWRLGDTSCDLLNVHFFHDHCNIGALQRGAERPALSTYARSRQKALLHTMRSVQTEAQEFWGTAPPATFVLGDYNFRLDLVQVIAHLCGADGLAQAMELTKESAPLRIPLVPGADASDARPGGKAKKKEAAAAGADGEPPSLLLAGKKCVLADYAPLLHDHETWRAFDVELNEYRQVAPTPLLELPLAFPPSYMRTPVKPATPDAAPGPADPSQLQYGPKRCPSWCDRVMMDAAGLELVTGARANATYDSQLWLPCYSDHIKVYLGFSCA